MFLEASRDCSSPPPPPAAPSLPPVLESSSRSNLPQELTLRYLCDAHEINNNNKGKEIYITTTTTPVAAGEKKDSPRWIERDFLQLAGENPRSSSDHPIETIVNRPRIDSKLNLSLGPPDLSLSLNNPPASTGDRNNLPHPAGLAPVKRAHSAATVTGNSEDFSRSMSLSMFPHNPSCSLTRNSTENFDSEQLWYPSGAGEGTNGSVHSRFRPVIGDSNTISFANNASFRDLNNGRGSSTLTGSESNSFFPSELPALLAGANGVASFRSRRDNNYMNSNNNSASVSSKPDRLVKEIVSESLHAVAQVLRELPNEAVESVKECLRRLVGDVERREEFLGLQRRLEQRTDLTMEALSKCHRIQLDVLVAVKTGIADFLSPKNRLSNAEMVEVFLLLRCRNMNCKSILPVNDCDCKICSTKKGFCSECMCPVCFNFDCAANSCSWVGCDVCAHWCHAVCGIQKNLIRPGPSLKGALRMTEMQFHCLGCGHASEMLGFVKEVFNYCAKEWELETMMKELDCVRKIFQGSNDFEGKALQGKAEEMLCKLSKKLISPSDACSVMLQFFKYGVADQSVTGGSSKSIFTAQVNKQEDAVSAQPSMTTTIPLKPAFSLKPSSSRVETLIDMPKANQRVHITEPHFTFPKKEEGGIQSVETMVRLKQEEAKLFQRHADEARREAESYRKIARAKTEKFEEEYATNIAKLRLQETQERRCRKLEELKFLETSQCDYQKMKLRMQAEIASLLERMESTRKQWV